MATEARENGRRIGTALLVLRRAAIAYLSEYEAGIMEAFEREARAGGDEMGGVEDWRNRPICETRATVLARISDERDLMDERYGENAFDSLDEAKVCLALYKRIGRVAEVVSALDFDAADERLDGEVINALAWAVAWLEARERRRSC